jgi:predicted porin
MVFAAHEIVDVDKPSPTGALQVYGAAKLSVDVIDTDSNTPGADSSLSRVSSNSSRLGFKGAEELNEGLSAVYQLELGVNMDDALATSLRNSYVGLKSNVLGQVILGTHDTPYKTSTGQFDNFADSMADYNAIIGNVNGATGFELRPKHVIAYSSPSWGGLQISALTSQAGSEAENTTPDARLVSASAVFKAGGLAVALAAESHKNDAANFAALGFETTGARLGAGYSFDFGTKIGFVFETLKDDSGETQYDRDAMYLAVSQKLGKETIKLAFGIADDGDTVAETGATFMAVGVDHAFTKDTSAYILYAATKNDADSTYGLGQGGGGGAYVPGAGLDPAVLSIGINYIF